MVESETIITWSPENWLTIVLMAAIGFLILGLIAQLYYKFVPGASPNAVSSSNS